MAFPKLVACALTNKKQFPGNEQPLTLKIVGSILNQVRFWFKEPVNYDWLPFQSNERNSPGEQIVWKHFQYANSLILWKIAVLLTFGLVKEKVY